MNKLTVLGFLIVFACSSFPLSGIAADEASTLARGGQLYDKWFKVIGAPTPSETHPAWP